MLRKHATPQAEEHKAPVAATGVDPLANVTAGEGAVIEDPKSKEGGVAVGKTATNKDRSSNLKCKMVQALTKSCKTIMLEAPANDKTNSDLHKNVLAATGNIGPDASVSEDSSHAEDHVEG